MVFSSNFIDWVLGCFSGQSLIIIEIDRCLTFLKTSLLYLGERNTFSSQRIYSQNNLRLPE